MIIKKCKCQYFIKLVKLEPGHPLKEPKGSTFCLIYKGLDPTW